MVDWMTVNDETAEEVTTPRLRGINEITIQRG